MIRSFTFAILFLLYSAIVASGQDLPVKYETGETAEGGTLVVLSVAIGPGARAKWRVAGPFDLEYRTFDIYDEIDGAPVKVESKMVFAAPAGGVVSGWIDVVAENGDWDDGRFLVTVGGGQVKPAAKPAAIAAEKTNVIMPQVKPGQTEFEKLIRIEFEKIEGKPKTFARAIAANCRAIAARISAGEFGAIGTPGEQINAFSLELTRANYSTLSNEAVGDQYWNAWRPFWAVVKSQFRGIHSIKPDRPLADYGRYLQAIADELER